MAHGLLLSSPCITGDTLASCLNLSSRDSQTKLEVLELAEVPTIVGVWVFQKHKFVLPTRVQILIIYARLGVFQYV